MNMFSLPTLYFGWKVADLEDKIVFAACKSVILFVNITIRLPSWGQKLALLNQIYSVTNYCESIKIITFQTRMVVGIDSWFSCGLMFKLIYVLF